MYQRRSYRYVRAGICMLAVCASCGCTVIRNEFRTNISEPFKFGNNVDVVRTRKHNKKLAKEALERFNAEHAEVSPLPDFRDGFIEGFADYLTFGGDGAPPVVPPRRYWNLPDRNPAGRNAVQAWFSGFAAGANEAKFSGLREQQTVPSTYAPVEDGSARRPNGAFEPEAPHADDTWEPLPTPSGAPRGEDPIRLDQPQGLRLPLPPGAAPSESPDAATPTQSNAERDPQLDSGAPSRPNRPSQFRDRNHDNGQEMPELGPPPGADASPQLLRPPSSQRRHHHSPFATQSSTIDSRIPEGFTVEKSVFAN